TKQHFLTHSRIRCHAYYDAQMLHRSIVRPLHRPEPILDSISYRNQPAYQPLHYTTLREHIRLAEIMAPVSQACVR
ncbi:Bgt-20663, partial [Blumeria graminis f. sp. tritici]